MSKKFENVEILAPVGGSEQLVAAVRCGANAVYLGAKGFNARRNAENFGADYDLPEAVRYCHAHGVRVHVTFNTLITDAELPNAIDTLRSIAESGADALIVQDLAVCEMVRTYCPSIPMHASTQMAVHNVSGVKVLEKLGFSRVVLARELTLPEIKSICENTDIEVETFVHGALCMGASGLCELSVMLGGRSGNRGLCAQPCRLDFRHRERGYALSLKDMSYIDHISELISAGVCSLKIEGRMKRPEYVAAAVTACHQAIAGEKYDKETLKAVFSRGGFTDGYLIGKRNLDMFGHRTKDDVTATQSALKTLSSLYHAERQWLPVNMILELRADANANLTVTCNDFCVRVQGNPPEAARTVAMDRDTAAKCLGSTGGTQFYLNNLSAFIDDGFTIPQSELKRMRREALVLLSERMSVPLPHAFNRDASVSAFLPHKSSKPMLRLRFEKAQQVFDVLEAELIILPLSEILKNKSLIKQFGSKLACELPAICYPLRENELLTTLQELQDIGLTEVIAENLYVIKLCNDLGLNVHGGMSLNILNSVSLEQYELLGIKDATVSFELPMNRVRRLSGKLPRGVVGYGYLPLMKFRACPVQQVSGCVGCSGISTLKDRKNESFTVICRNKQYSEFLNCVPLYVADKAIENVDFITLYFTVETNEHCREIVKLFISGQTPNFRYTRGMYYRDLL